MSPAQMLSAADPMLANIIAATPQPMVESTHDVFHDLMSCVIEQQIHYRSTKRTFQKLLDKAGLTRLSPENFAQFEHKALPDLKLSAQKYDTMLGVLACWAQHGQPAWPTLTDDDVARHLAFIKGIGRWTMDMVLLYTLQRPNVCPYDDFHLKKAMTALYGLDPKSRLKAQMKEVSEAWEGHKSLAVLYLLAWKAGGRGIERRARR